MAENRRFRNEIPDGLVDTKLKERFEPKTKAKEPTKKVGDKDGKS